MEEKAPPRRSVAELAGKFKGPSPSLNNPAGNEADKPVRRRPPRTLQLPKTHGDNQEPPAVTSPPKPKRNSFLIEKLQANLALSPTAAPLKSPGLRVLPLSFTPPSPGSTPISTGTASSSTTPTSPVSTSPLTEEGPTSFEAPPSTTDGNILSSINKGRARVSIRRRPPSRRHRISSSGDEGSVVTDTQQNPSGEVEERSGTGGGGKEEEVFSLTESSPPEKTELCEEKEMKISADEKKREEEEGVSSSSQLKEEVEDGGSSSSKLKEEVEDGGSSSSKLKEEVEEEKHLWKKQEPDSTTTKNEEKSSENSS